MDNPAQPETSRVAGKWNWLRSKLFEPTDIASIVAFRIMFGCIMVWEVYRFFNNEWIRKYYISRDFYFKYYGFEWVKPWQEYGWVQRLGESYEWLQPWIEQSMYIHFFIVGVLAIFVCLGLFYRVSAVLLFLFFTFWFLLDQTRYLNHLYMSALVAFVMAITPAHRARSLDARWNPKIRADTIPAWHLWSLRLLLAIVYFYAAIAKMNGDWLRLEPIRDWLSNRWDYPLIGWFLDSEAGVWFCGHGGLLFDLLVVPAFCFKKTRPWAFAACVFFHVFNKMLFNIGIFPTMMLAATLLFFCGGLASAGVVPFQTLGKGAGLGRDPASGPQCTKLGHRRICPVFHCPAFDSFPSPPVSWVCPLDGRRAPFFLAHEVAL